MALSKALKWTLIGSLVAIPVAGFLLWRGFSRGFLGDVAGAEAALESERAAARRDGLPIEPEELFPDRPIDPKLNAGPAIAREAEAISRLTPADGAFRTTLAEIRKGISGTGHSEVVRSHLATVKPHLDRILAAIDRPYCDFGKDYGQGFNIPFPELAAIKSVVHVLAGGFWLAAREGRFSEARRSLGAAFRLARFAGEEPVLIGSLVQIACSTIAHDALRQTLGEFGRDPRLLQVVKPILAAANVPTPIARAYQGELVAGIASIRTLKSIHEIAELGVRDTGPASLADSMVPAMRKAWETRFIQFWRRVNKRLPKDRNDFLAIRKVTDDEVAIEESKKSLDYLLNKILLPIFSEANLSACRERAQFALSSAMLSLLEFRLNNHRFPDRLDQLGQEFIDPFDGESLRYRRQGDGFLLYSIDRNLKDDGGKKREPNSPIDSPFDLVVAYP